MHVYGAAVNVHAGKATTRLETAGCRVPRLANRSLRAGSACNQSREHLRQSSFGDERSPVLTKSEFLFKSQVRDTLPGSAREIWEIRKNSRCSAVRRVL